MKFTLVALLASVSAVHLHNQEKSNMAAVERMKNMENVQGWWKDMKDKYGLAQEKTKGR